MAKFFWVDARPFRKELVTAALESGAEAVVVDKGFSKDVAALGIIKTVAPDGDLKPNENVFEFNIKSRDDEEAAARAPANAWAVVRCDDWKIIPLENLVAKRPGKLIAAVKSAEEAKIALEILERGVDGVILETSSAAEIKKLGSILIGATERLDLVAAKIIAVKSLGMGDRVCVDTATLIKPGAGLLVGDSSSGMLLVHAENVETPYCDPRPFRVNAGAVHAYVRVPDGKTKYLADLATGGKVLIVGHDGKGETAYVGRSKTERRPLLLVEAEYKGRKITLVLQNAETIRLTRPDGSPASVVALKAGDEVLAYLEEAGRHFGQKVQETIKEK